jgi:hypothetical protein
MIDTIFNTNLLQLRYDYVASLLHHTAHLLQQLCSNIAAKSEQTRGNIATKVVAIMQ